MYILIQLVTGTATKPGLSGNMLPNIKTRENFSNFKENLRVMTLKLLALTRFLSPNLSIYFNFVWCWGPFDRERFSVHSPFICTSISKNYISSSTKLTIDYFYIIILPSIYPSYSDSNPQKILKQTSLRSHMLVHTRELPHTCRICSRSFPKELWLIKHMKNAHRETNQDTLSKLLCQFCGNTFSTK